MTDRVESHLHGEKQWNAARERLQLQLDPPNGPHNLVVKIRCKELGGNFDGHRVIETHISGLPSGSVGM